MRYLLILVGLALLAAGIWVVFGHASYQTTETLVQFGDAKLTVPHDKPVPSWIGIAGMAVGAILALGGFFKKG